MSGLNRVFAPPPNWWLSDGFIEDTCWWFPVSPFKKGCMDNWSGARLHFGLGFVWCWFSLVLLYTFNITTVHYIFMHSLNFTPLIPDYLMSHCFFLYSSFLLINFVYHSHFLVSLFLLRPFRAMGRNNNLYTFSYPFVYLFISQYNIICIQTGLNYSECFFSLIIFSLFSFEAINLCCWW